MLISHILGNLIIGLLFRNIYVSKKKKIHFFKKELSILNINK